MDFANYFSKNHKVSVITYSDNIGYLDFSIPVYKAFIDRKRFFHTLHRTKRWLKEIKPDIIISLNMDYHAGIASLTGFHPFILFSYGSDVSYNAYLSIFKNIVCRYILFKTDLILAQDKIIYERLRDLGVNSKKIFVQHWGVDTKFYHPKKMKKKYDVINLRGYNTTFYCYTDIYLEAIAILKNRGVKIKPILIGNNGYYDEIINNLGLKDFLIQKPYLNKTEFRQILWESKIMIDPVYPVYHDGTGYGISLIQTMAIGTPVICADRRSVLLNEDDKWFYGKFFEHCNPNDLADKIQFLLNKEDELISISEQNQISVEKNFNQDVNRKIIEDKIKELIK